MHSVRDSLRVYKNLSGVLCLFLRMCSYIGEVLIE